MRAIVYQCAKCGTSNTTTYPSKKDLTPVQLGQKNREDPPLGWVSHDLSMWVGLRRCKNCKTWNVVVFCGWWFEKHAFAYLPYKTELGGTLGPKVAKWCIEAMQRKGVKIPRSLKS